MAEVWPPGLPQAHRVGASETFPSVVVRSEMDAGAAKVRRRFTAGPSPHRETMALDGTQIATLKTFHDVTLQGGVLPFEWKRLSTDSSPVLFRFRGPPEIRLLSGGASAGEVRFEASLDLEVLP